MKKMLESTIGNIDGPVDFNTGLDFIKKGKVRVVIIYEDRSYKEYFVKLKADYAFTIKNKKYIIYPESIVFGKHRTIYYYFNNPLPMHFAWQKSKLTAADLRSQETLDTYKKDVQDRLASIPVDGSMVHQMVENQVLKHLYDQNSMNARGYIMVAGAVLIGILVVLQVTGTVDVMGFLQGSTGG